MATKTHTKHEGQVFILGCPKCGHEGELKLYEWGTTPQTSGHRFCPVCRTDTAKAGYVEIGWRKAL